MADEEPMTPSAKKRPENRKQRFPREKYRLTCELVLLGKQSGGIVTDMSASGLFVRTSETHPPGTTLRVRIRAENNDEFELDVRVARIHKASRHHTTAVPSGLGLQIVSAPESYFQFLAALSTKRTAR